MPLRQIKIRSAKAKDSFNILKLVKSVSGDEREFDFKQFVIASKDDKLIGCIRTVQAEKDCKEMASLVVSPNYRRKGIGTELIKRILRKDDHRPLYLICKSDKSDIYKKNDFRTCNTSLLPSTLKRDYLSMLKEDKDFIVMKLL